MRVELKAPRNKGLAEACSRVTLKADNESDQLVLKMLGDVCGRGKLGSLLRIGEAIERGEATLQFNENDKPG